MTVKHSDDDANKYRRIALGDKDVRNAMVEHHLGLVQSLASYYAKRNPHLDMDDLIQEGRIGIVIALGKFDVDKGYRFSTYATYWVKHYIQRYVVGNHSGGATTSKKDTEAYIGRTMPDDERRVYERRCIKHTSLSSDGGQGTNYDELIEDKDVPPVEEMAFIKNEWNNIERLLFHDTISAHERMVVCMRFGVMGFRPHTLSEVSSELGISAPRVSVMEQQTVAHLAELTGGNDGDD